MIALISFLVLVSDQLSKLIAARAGMTILNTGVSFGFLSTFSAGWLTLALVFLVIATWWSYRLWWVKVPIAAGLFLGGAFSNLFDRLIWGGVRDWIPIPGTTIINNSADYAIGIGLVWLAWSYIRDSHRQHQSSLPKTDDSIIVKDKSHQDQS